MTIVISDQPSDTKLEQLKAEYEFEIEYWKGQSERLSAELAYARQCAIAWKKAAKLNRALFIDAVDQEVTTALELDRLARFAANLNPVLANEVHRSLLTREGPRPDPPHHNHSLPTTAECETEEKYWMADRHE